MDSSEGGPRTKEENDHSERNCHHVIRSQGKRSRSRRVRYHPGSRRHRRDCRHALARTQDR